MGLEPIFDREIWARVPFHFWSFVFFAFGCNVGSFLNVCIYRMPLGLSVVRPPSHCPHCKYSIPWFLNVPLLTWLMLRGKCKNCRAPISIRYFLVELLTGLMFLACWLRFGAKAATDYSPAVPPSLHSAAITLVMCVLMAGFIAATFIDLEHFIIPDEITLGGIGAGFLFSFLLPALQETDSASVALVRSLLGIGVGAGVVYAIVRLGKLMFGRKHLAFPPDTRIVFSETAVHLPDRDVPFEELFYRASDVIKMQARRVELVDRCYCDVPVSLSPKRLQIGDDEFEPEKVPHMEAVSGAIVLPQEAMGFGDVKFMAAIGAFLGWQATIFSLMVSSFIGACVGIALIVVQKREWSSKIPYGPYIAAAAVIWMFWGRPIWDSLFTMGR